MQVGFAHIVEAFQPFIGGRILVSHPYPYVTARIPGYILNLIELVVRREGALPDISGLHIHKIKGVALVIRTIQQLGFRNLGRLIRHPGRIVFQKPFHALRKEVKLAFW